MTFAAVVIIAIVTLVGSTIAGVTGYGAGLMLLPVLSLTVGTKTAIPMLAIIQLTSNFSRVVINRKAVKWDYGVWFGVGAVPGALLGAWLFSRISVTGLDKIVGSYMVLLPWIRRRFSKSFELPPKGFIGIGFVTSLISSLVGVVGPLCAPFFLALGLARGAFVGTEAVGSVFTHVSKITGYGLSGTLTLRAFLIGCAISPITWLGSWLGKLSHNRMKDHHFTTLIDAICILFGLLMLFKKP